MAQSFVPLELESLNHDLLIELYTKFIRSETAMYPNKLFEDIFALYIWCGMSEKANASLGSFRKVVDSWPQNVANKLGGGAVWEQSVLAKYSSRLQLHRSVEERIVELKLTGVPNGGFACR